MLSCRRFHSASCLKVTALTRYRSRLTMRRCLSQYGAAAAHKGEWRHCGRVDEIRFFVNGRPEADSSHAFSENRPAGARQEYGYRRLARPFYLLRAARRQTPFDRSRVQYLCFAGLFRQQGVRGDEPLHRRGHAGHRLSAHFSRPLGSSGLCHGNGASVQGGAGRLPPRRRGPF